MYQNRLCLSWWSLVTLNRNNQYTLRINWLMWWTVVLKKNTLTLPSSIFNIYGSSGGEKAIVGGCCCLVRVVKYKCLWNRNNPRVWFLLMKRSKGLYSTATLLIRCSSYHLFIDNAANIITTITYAETLFVYCVYKIIQFETIWYKNATRLTNHLLLGSFPFQTL